MSESPSQIMVPRLKSRSLFCALFLACSLLVISCVNLEDVAQLTKLADDAQQTLPAVVADIPASCQRQNLLVNDIPSNERPPNLLPQCCKPYQDVADHLMKDQGILIAYFDALGKLASNTPLSYGKAIDANVTIIGKLPNLTKNTIAASNAAQKIAKVLADAVTHSYRAGKVNSIVLRTDDAVQELTVDMKKVIVEDYAKGILSNENELVDTYYRSPMEAAGQSEPLCLILVQHQYHEATTALESRKAAATDYGKVMDNLALLHAKLRVEATKKASLREVAKEIGPDISNLRDAISQLQTDVK